MYASVCISMAAIGAATPPNTTHHRLVAGAAHDRGARQQQLPEHVRRHEEEGHRRVGAPHLLRVVGLVAPLVPDPEPALDEGRCWLWYILDLATATPPCCADGVSRLSTPPPIHRRHAHGTTSSPPSSPHVALGAASNRSAEPFIRARAMGDFLITRGYELL